MCEIVVDGRPVRARAGASLLAVLLDAGVYVAHLCGPVGGGAAEGSCRLCFVEVAGRPEPVCACETPVEDGMEVSTCGQRALELARGAFELLVADHDVRCGECALRDAEGGCAFKRAARYLDVGLKTPWELGDKRRPKLGQPPAPVAVDDAKCVLCGRCVRACAAVGQRAIQVVGRGYDARIRIEPGECAACGACVQSCPAAALRAQ